MYILFTILCVIAAVLLVLLVLVQNSKGGGLAAGFNSGNQVMGVRKTTDFLEKATWVLISFIVLMSVFAIGLSKHQTTVDPNQSVITDQAVEASQELATPVQGFAEEAEAEE